MASHPSSNLAAGFLGRRCLVTGGAGFIGSNLTRALLGGGAQVTVVDNLSTGLRENLPDHANLALVEADLTTWPGLAGRSASSDYVFHLAAQVGNVKSITLTEEDAATNVLGSVRLLKSCCGTGVKRVVYSSSSAIFGEAERIPIDEDHPQSPASFYALSKMTGEKYALLAASLWDVPTVCLRYFNVYGLPMQDNEYTGVISIFSNRLAADEPLVIYGDGEQFRDFVSVRDVVQANLRAALFGRPGRTYNVGSGEPTSIRQLACVMSEIAGRPTRIVHRDFRAGEVRRSLAEIARASAELGYAPEVVLRQGLTALMEPVPGQC